MRKILDWQNKAVVNVFDEVTLWSAPFGRLLLEHMPMKSNAVVVDIGFGTGFPLIELSQRFGEDAKIYGIDIWKEGISRVKDKIDVLEIGNIEIIEASAAKIALADNQIDLVTSNLGVNNFEQKAEVYKEIYRILKRNGRLCITTNPIGTFKELFDIFRTIFQSMNLKEELSSLEEYILHRNTESGIIAELEAYDLSLVKRKADMTNMRFVSAEAILNHSLIRIGFRESWEKLVRRERRDEFFEQLIIALESTIESNGEFNMTIPMLYLEFEKK